MSQETLITAYWDPVMRQFVLTFGPEVTWSPDGAEFAASMVLEWAYVALASGRRVLIEVDVGEASRPQTVRLLQKLDTHHLDGLQVRPVFMLSPAPESGVLRDSRHSGHDPHSSSSSTPGP